MNNPNYPNYLGLFLHLRDAGMSLTVEQYLLFQQALTLGFGQSNLADLKQLCRLLWFKPKESFNSGIFDTEFDRYFARFQSEKLLETPLKPETIKTPPTPEITPNPNPSTPDKIPTPKPSNSVQIPIALRGEGFRPQNEKKPSKDFSFNVQNLPVTERQILQSWRFLRYPIPEGHATELDIPATLAQIYRQGQIFEPVFRPRRVNSLELLLLIDWDGSMIPFHILAQQLITSLKKHTFGKTQIYYFRNCPHNYLYLFPNQPQAKPLDEILPTLHKNRTIVVIFSDGGAGRGNYNPERIELTQVFFDQIEPLVRSIIWFNPLPEDRWQNTTASGIIETLHLPMFEFNCSGLNAMVRVISRC